MTVSLNWTVDQIDVIPALDGNHDVVKTVHWRLFAVDGAFSTSVYGAQDLGAPSGAFIAYDKLDEPTVVGWVKSAMGDDRVKEVTDAAISQLNAVSMPTTVSQPLPWANTGQ